MARALPLTHQLHGVIAIRSSALLLTILLSISLVGGPAAVRGAALQDPRSLVVGIADNGHVRGGGVVLGSGSWGTDYLTVSHALSVGGRYEITVDGKKFEESTPVVACSSFAQGIDALVLRVASHLDRTAVVWGEPSELRLGDELTIVPRSEIHPTLERARFLHLNFLQWLRAEIQQRPSEWTGWSEVPINTFFPREFHNTSVIEGFSKPGFSGSPLVREGKVFGILKGSWQPQRWTGHSWDDFGSRLVFFENATRIAQCLELVHYADLVPKP